jgi:hypothetical protein
VSPWADGCPCDFSVYADRLGEMAELDERNNGFGPIRIERPFPRW